MLLLLLPPQVGAVVAALKARGMWNNTLWVTSADNGGPISGGANNYPLRGGKFTNFEGGIRVNGGGGVNLVLRGPSNMRRPPAAFASGGALPAVVRGTTYAGLAAMPDLCVRGRLISGDPVRPYVRSGPPHTAPTLL